jgi:hypothetical protein
MNKRNWPSIMVAIQLLNAFLLFVFSAYLAVAAYPLVAFFQSREVTITYIVNVGVFMALGVLALVCWRGLRNERRWGWWVALMGNAIISVLTTLDSLSMGLRETYFQLPLIALLSGVVAISLLMPDMRDHYGSPRSIRPATLRSNS